MSSFTHLQSENDLKEIIQTAFSLSLEIGGSWGYTKASATIIYHTQTPLPSFEHTFASMRAYTEMNLTQEKTDRYGSINVKESKREEHQEGSKIYHQVTYEITAMKESEYNHFIEIYKTSYGKENFDLEAHFEARARATLHREVTHWFEVSHLLQKED